METSNGLDCVYYGSDEHEPVARFVKDGGRKFVWAKGGFKSEELEVNIEGDYNLDNIATAIACGLEFQVDEKDIGEAISEYIPSNNRSQTTKTEKNTIILDAYNANPSSMTGALESFAKNIEGEKLVVLGDMRELGIYSHEAHKEIVGLCDRLGLDAVFVGEEFYEVNERDSRIFSRVDDMIT